MSRIIVTGGKGQLGQTLRREMPLAGLHNVEFIDVDDLDITDEEAVMRYFEEHPCSFLVNCAAYTAVDRAEDECEQAYNVNAMAVLKLANAAKEYGFKIIQISTDYVFSGCGNRPYREEDEIFDIERQEGPFTVYGRTKLLGEIGLQTMIPLHHVIIRTSWLYSEYGHNFFRTMLRKAVADEKVRVVADQKGCPTYAGDLAKVIISVIKSETWKPGIYHYCNSGVTSWHGFASAIYEIAGKDPANVIPIMTEDYPTAARRPKYSALDTGKIKAMYGVDCPDWRDSLKKMSIEYTKWN